MASKMKNNHRRLSFTAIEAHTLGLNVFHLLNGMANHFSRKFIVHGLQFTVNVLGGDSPLPHPVHGLRALLIRGNRRTRFRPMNQLTAP